MSIGTPLRVLFVEDPDNDALLLEQELRGGGYDVWSRRVQTASEMREALKSQTWDVVTAFMNLDQAGARLAEPQ